MEVVVLSVITIVGAPLLQSFGFVENTAVRLLIVLAILYAVTTSHGPMPGLLAFLAAFTLLVERNHEVLMKFPDQKPRFPTTAYGFPVKAPAREPDVKIPDVGKDAVNDVDLRDNNPRLSEGPHNNSAPNFYKSKGLL